MITEKDKERQELAHAAGLPSLPLLIPPMPGVPPPPPEAVDEPQWGGGNTYLHELCENGAPLMLVREAVERMGADVNATNERGLPPLAMAIAAGTEETVRYLLYMGAHQDIPPFNAVLYATVFEVPDVLDLLLETAPGRLVNCGGLVRATNTDVPPIYMAVQAGCPRMVQSLLAKGALVNRPLHPGGQTVLHRYASQPQAGLMPVLLRYGADPGARDHQGYTPLHHAVQADSPAQVAALVDAGGDVEAVDDVGETPIFNAAISNSPKALAALLAAGACVDRRGMDGRTALMLAAQRDHLAIVEMLLAAGADPLLSDDKGKTARNYASPGSDSLLLLREKEEESLSRHFNAVAKRRRQDGRPPSSPRRRPFSF